MCDFKFLNFTPDEIIRIMQGDVKLHQRKYDYHDDAIKGILLYMLDEKLLETRVRKKTKKQEFAITDKGHDVMRVLQVFGGEAKSDGAQILCIKCDGRRQYEREVVCSAEESQVMMTKFEGTFRRVDEACSDMKKTIGLLQLDVVAITSLIKHQRNHFDRIFKEKMK